MTACIDDETLRELCDSYLKMKIVLTNKKIFRCINRELCRKQAEEAFRQLTHDQMDPRPHRLEQTVPRPSGELPSQPPPAIGRVPGAEGVRVPGRVPPRIPAGVRMPRVPGGVRMPGLIPRVPGPAPPDIQLFVDPSEEQEEESPPEHPGYMQTTLDGGTRLGIPYPEEPQGAARDRGHQTYTSQDENFTYTWVWESAEQQNYAGVGRFHFQSRRRRPRRRAPESGTQTTLFGPKP